MLISTGMRIAFIYVLGTMIRMENQKPKSIKTLGIAIAAISGAIIFSNGSGLLMMNLLPTEGSPMQDPLFANFNYIAGTALIFALGFLISGLFISRYKNWARKMGQLIAGLIVIGIWALMIFMNTNSVLEEPFSFFPLFVALFWSIPPIILIFYLNKDKIKQHFA